ncbi:hypothetical protein DOM21_09235 [Bacteriovorax stolpii]|uniref:Uncharacterized protein n=1 Tax=Bacteriovorax stolpii TaxID=960 RepID=A0A2K9NS92_BACTC|nr:hypothetical protein [Bacteriovorax stolpii]AUN98389.1 hypothetical protein C0V70_09780 [Bacteriovorax stolpii]QDK41631.1 hypothetical protein DOM21_09235 [Bacteriovorax stolpii]TDP50990.1 hypothetical protein C8D79_3729 [Bacteriovorax stolpii]
MNIDNKLLNLKSYLSENKLGKSGIKTTLNESAVAGSEKNNVDLNLDGDSKNPNEKSKKKQKNKEATTTQKETKEVAPVKSDAEIKQANLKKLNLL